MSGRVSRLRGRWQRSRTVLLAPRVRIELFGGDEARAAHRAFTTRHPRFRVTAAKRWGVALLRLPDSFDAYLAGASSLVRRRRAAATKAGFRYAVVDPNDHLDEIIEVNRSAPARQGRPMASVYTDRGEVVRTFARHEPIDAVLDGSGRLRAYAVVPDLGDAFVFSFILGHADDLERGITYLLATESIRRAMDRRRPDGTPGWFMYDTFWGASDGLAFFKERLGFRPYTVDWRWVER